MSIALSVQVLFLFENATFTIQNAVTSLRFEALTGTADIFTNNLMFGSYILLAPICDFSEGMFSRSNQSQNSFGGRLT